MLGAIIGDIVGSRFEFANHLITPQFELFTPDCNFTDDTICTVSIADSVLNNTDYAENMRRWCGKYPNPMGDYGGLFRDWLSQPNALPHNSFGNGAAMRVSPIGWLFNDFHTLINESSRCTTFSHCHSEAVKGAQCVASLIYWLRTCRITKNEIEEVVKKTFGYDIPSLAEIYKIGNQKHFDAICQETVPWAIRCFMDSNNFEEAIRLAVMAGGDTDTKAAICGSIAEAYYQIPNELVEQAYGYLPADMLAVIEQFYERMLQHVND